MMEWNRVAYFQANPSQHLNYATRNPSIQHGT